MPRKQHRIRAFSCVGLVLLIAALIIGCGGGGGPNPGSTSSTSTATTSTTSSTATAGSTGNWVNVHLIGVYAGTNSPVNLTISSSGAVSQSYEVGDSIQFEYVGTDSINSQKHAVLQGETVITNSSGNIGTMSGGVYTVKGTSNGNSYKAGGVYQGQELYNNFVTVPTMARVSGLIRDPSSKGIYGIPVLFYNSSGALVGQTLSGVDGTFIGEVPTSATRFSLELSTFKSYYYSEFAYGTLNYATTSSSCSAPLPGLVAGGTTALPNAIALYVYDTNNPPPPPDGCR